MIRSGKASLDDLAAVLLITWKLNLSNTTGLHFNLPCVETHEIVDMRTITLGVPPQEVHTLSTLALLPLPPPPVLLPALLYMSFYTPCTERLPLANPPAGRLLYMFMFMSSLSKLLDIVYIS